MAARSAGLLLYRAPTGGLEVFLVHPGGPFWKNKDDGAWTIPKGEIAASEDPLATARREFREETGLDPDALLRPGAGYVDLGEIQQKGGKRVRCWAIEGDADPAAIRSNTFEIEWPPRSGRRRAFPEVDRAAWFDLAQARRKINAAQVELLDRLSQHVEGERAAPRSPQA